MSLESIFRDARSSTEAAERFFDQCCTTSPRVSPMDHEVVAPWLRERIADTARARLIFVAVDRQGWPKALLDTSDLPVPDGMTLPPIQLSSLVFGWAAQDTRRLMLHATAGLLRLGDRVLWSPAVAAEG